MRFKVLQMIDVLVVNALGSRKIILLGGIRRMVKVW